MKFLAMHITNQKLSFDIFMVGNLQNIFMERDLNILMIFVIKEKSIILTHTMYCCLLLQIYLCYLWLLLCSRVKYYILYYIILYYIILYYYNNVIVYAQCTFLENTFNVIFVCFIANTEHALEGKTLQLADKSLCVCVCVCVCACACARVCVNIWRIAVDFAFLSLSLSIWHVFAHTQK